MDLIEKARLALEKYLGEEVVYKPTRLHANAFYTNGKYGYNEIAYLRGNIIVAKWDDQDKDLMAVR